MREVNADIVWSTRVSEAPSPDRSWDAIVDETTVEGLIATSIVANVRLLSTSYPTRVEEILSVDTGGHADERPRIAWTGPDVLQVQVAPSDPSYVTIKKPKWSGVRVVVRLEPYDPAVANEWLRRFRTDPTRAAGR